jgi:YidC/Oxa1 family membrane protein insertase
MDRRTILAFLLIGVIIVLTPYYSQLLTGKKGDTGPIPSSPSRMRGDTATPSVVQEPPARATIETPVEAPPVQAEAARVAPALAPSPATQTPTFQPRQILVETDHYLATFTTMGGRLISLRLKDYADAYGGPVELMPADGAGLGLSLGGRNLEAYEFVADKSGLVLSGSELGELVFSCDIDGATLRKRLWFQGDRYRVDMRVDAGSAQKLGGLGVSWIGALADTEDDLQHATHSTLVTSVGGEVEKWAADDLGPEVSPPSGRVTWTGVRSKYFLAAIIPPEGRYDLHMAGRLDADTGNPHFGFEMVAQDPVFGQTYGIYWGPISYSLLRAQNRDLSGVEAEIDLDEFIDYGWAIIRPIMKPITVMIIKAFVALHEFVPNYGVVIIVFSLFIKIIVFPMTHKSLEAAAKMQELQPKIAALKERLGDDSQKMNQEMMKLYKEEKVNPLGGCLPMLPQMPILFSLFNVFRGAIELRQAGFMLWMDDLSQPDRLMIGGFELHVLPLLMGISSFLQSKMTMKDPKQAAMVYVMPVFMTWIFWSMSSGLVLYWTMFNVLTLLQQQVMEYTKSALERK